MLRQELARKVSDALGRLIAAGDLPEACRVEFEILDTKNPDHGDYSCNLAMIAAKPAGMNPRAIGEKLQKALAGDDAFAAVDLAGPGFINFKLKPESVNNYVAQVLELGEKLPAALGSGLAARGSGPRIEIEYVSVNPNGPITVGSGRGAAFGDTLARVLEAAGSKVTREYYINDGVNSEQMRQFAYAVRRKCQTHNITEFEFVGDKVDHDRSIALNNEFIKSLGRDAGGYTVEFFHSAFQNFLKSVSNSDAEPWREERASRTLQRLEQSSGHNYSWTTKERHKFAWLTGEFRDPEAAYKGEYVDDVAREVMRLYGENFVFERSFEPDSLPWFQQVSEQLMIERQRTDLHSFGVDFDIWFSEQKDLHDKNKVKEALTWLEGHDHAYWGVKPEVEPEGEAKEEKDDESTKTDGEPALWLRSTKLGDDKDRVLMRADGRPTYISADVAYLKDKFDRGYEKCYLILGPDHHGYIGRMYAVCRALGKTPPKDFEIIIFQIVRFMKDGKPAPMRKRDGNIYELRDLIQELGQAVAPNASKEEQEIVGRDVSRFFYLMRSHETHMDFDIDLATKQSDENPVFYVQYAHARICGVLRKAEEALGSGLEARAANASLLVHPRELALIKKILDLPEEVQRTAKDYGVHRIANYSIELARTFHHFYDACRVILPEEPELTQARLALVKAAQIALKSALSLLGVSAPDKMERAVEAEEGA